MPHHPPPGESCASLHILHISSIQRQPARTFDDIPQEIREKIYGNLKCVKDLSTVSTFGPAHLDAARRSFGNLDIQAKIDQLHLAATSGNKGAVQFCMGIGLDANIVNGTDGDGLTALCLATKNGHADIVEKLLTLPGIDSDIGEPLVLALNHQKLKAVNIDTIKLLLQTRSIKVLHQDPYIPLGERDSDDPTVLDRAIEHAERLLRYQEHKSKYLGLEWSLAQQGMALDEGTTTYLSKEAMSETLERLSENQDRYDARIEKISSIIKMLKHGV